MNLKTQQFYALVLERQGRETLADTELILYFLNDRSTFIEVAPPRKGAFMVDSPYDYSEWWNKRKRPSDYGRFIYKPISLAVFLTHDQPLFREFARRYLGLDHSQLWASWVEDLSCYRLFALDFDYDSGQIGDYSYWYNSPHDYILIREGNVKFETTDTNQRFHSTIYSPF